MITLEVQIEMFHPPIKAVTRQVLKQLPKYRTNQQDILWGQYELPLGTSGKSVTPVLHW